ncbi:MAG: type II toxin-antitoxin system HicA family toxin [Nitrospinae bacterium]|nr:type II toxin-antitoxin system HicA family toxin [Nitrospinota bacterium]
MGKAKKVYRQILTGRSDQNISFQDLRLLLSHLGFAERVKGGHHIYTKTAIEEIINIQEKSGKAKPYQVKQIRHILFKYKVEPEDE